MTTLNDLLAAAARADPWQRIDFRDRIASYGKNAVGPLESWIQDPRLGAFAVRTLERIANESSARPLVLDALASVNLATVQPNLAQDIATAIAGLTGRARKATGGVNRSGAARAEDWPGLRKVSALELRFHDEMLDIFRLAGEATRRRRPDGTTVRGYWASYFLRGVRNHGGPGYAHQLLRKQGTSDGFRRLTEEGRLDLSVEALILKPDYSTLFTELERGIAAQRLAEAGYQPSGR